MTNKNLRQARINAGFKSAKEAADAFGWKYQTYSGHESGFRSVTLEIAQRYAEAFNTAPEPLVYSLRRRNLDLAVDVHRLEREVERLRGIISLGHDFNLTDVFVSKLINHITDRERMLQSIDGVHDGLRRARLSELAQIKMWIDERRLTGEIGGAEASGDSF